MKTLLKDMPGFSEPIDNNSLLLSKISDILSDIEVENNMESIQDTIIRIIAKTLQGVEFIIIDGNKITLDDKEGLAQLIFNAIEDDLTKQNDFIIQNENDISNTILNEVAEFVNENYTIKG